MNDNCFSSRGGHFKKSESRGWLNAYANRSITARPFGDEERFRNDLPPVCGGNEFTMPVIDHDRQQGNPSEYGDN